MAKICNECGYKNDDTAVKCEHCGALLNQAPMKKTVPPVQNVQPNTGKKPVDNMMPQKKKSPKIMILIICCIVLFAGVAVLGVFLIRGSMTQKTYKEQISYAQKYLEDLDFEQAVTAFKMAMEANPDREEPYIGLFQTYSAQDNLTLALSFLQQGYDRTHSPRLQYLLARYINKTETAVDAAEEVQLTAEEVKEYSDEVEMNTAFIQKLKNYTYLDYKQKFGTSNAGRKENAGMEVTCSDFAGKIYFQDTDENKQVVDETIWKPFDQATPTYIVLDDLLSIFTGYVGGVTSERLEMMTGGNVKQEYSEDAQSQIVRFTSGGCVIEIACVDNGNVTGTTGVWNRIYPPAAGETDEEKGHVIGVVLNATDGKGIDSASLTASPVSGGTEETWETESDGSYEVDLDEGVYKVTAEKDGFVTEEYDLEVAKGEQTDAGTWTMSPELASGEIRIVLEWAAAPADLDSHLDGATTDGNSISVNYTNEVAQRNGKTYAGLDIDDMNGYGPETITIYDTGGTYDYWVEDFRWTGTIGDCGATVKVYVPGQPVQTITVPSGSGNIWDVCRIENGQVTVSNVIENMARD